MLSIWNWLGENASTIIALSALFLTGYQFTATKKHNKLSVKPHIVDSSHTALTDDNAIYEYTLTNNGIGPAEITSWQITLDGKNIEDSKFNNIEKFAKSLVEQSNNISSIELKAGYVLGTKEHICIFKFDTLIESKEHFSEIRGNLDRLNLRIKYKSVYGDEFIYDTNENS